MNVLFVHQNYPGQFLHLAAHLGQTGHQVVGLGQRHNQAPEGTRLIEYEPAKGGAPVHHYLHKVDEALRNAEGVALACKRLKDEGFIPDIVVGHTGWGETLYVKDVWPGAPVLGYFEYFYRPTQSDIDFDAEFPVGDDIPRRLLVRNGVSLMAMETADWGLTPTRWQYDSHPVHMRARISIAHEGIDTDVVRPDRGAAIRLASGRSFRSGDDVVTFSARDLEPYRGFHVFMRALPELMRRRADTHFLVVGQDGVSYGLPHASGTSWRTALLRELDGQLDLARLHFLGPLRYSDYLAVLRVSAAHAYFTYPFVLSWSLLEALSTGCHVVASRTAPVAEVVDHDVNGHLVGFFDAADFVDRVCDALSHRPAWHPVRDRARDTILERYDLKTTCLPAQMALLHDLAGGAGWSRRQPAGFPVEYPTQIAKAPMAYMPPHSILKDGICATPDGELIIMSRDVYNLLIEALSRAGGFDTAWYGEQYPDVSDAVAQGEIANELQHFVLFGYEEGRAPAPLAVDADWYRETNPDIDRDLEAGRHESAEQHYNQIGYFEGRAANPENEAEVSRWLTAIGGSRERLERSGGNVAIVMKQDDDVFFEGGGVP